MTSFGKTLAVGVAGIIIIVGIALLSLTTGDTSPVGSVPVKPAEPAKAVTFENAEAGFSFAYPKSFTSSPIAFADPAGYKTLLVLENTDKNQKISVALLLDAKTGKPLSPEIAGYEKSLIADTIFDGSGENPKSFDEFQLRKQGEARFAFIKTGLFEGILGVNYYAIVPGGIVRFSLVSQGVDWTNPDFDAEKDAGHLALKSMLSTFRVGAYRASVSSAVTTYKDPAGIFSLDVIANSVINTKFSYDAIGPEKGIPGTSFAFPTEYFAATNLSKDSYISVEKNPYATACKAYEFISSGVAGDESEQVTLGGVEWNKGNGSDVALGNYYNETVYSTKYGNDCYGIRLFLHSGAIDNYDPGARQQYDSAKLLEIQKKAVASFKFLK